MKTCVSCSASFEISSDDQAFYKKISPTFNGVVYDIDEPTHCPECRQQRRLAWRNDRKLYKRNCDISGKELISMFAPDVPVKVIDKNIYFGDSWDPLNYGKDFDFSRSFFEQFSELLSQVPYPQVIITQDENSDYTNYNERSKNCYMCAAGNYSEDCMYGYNVQNSVGCTDNFFLYNSQYCYECVHCSDSYKLFYSLHCSNCSDSWFLEDCNACKNCIFCWNLRNKEYCIFNTQYEKKEYEIKKQELLSKNIDELQKIFQSERKKYIKRENHNLLTENCSGDYILESKHCSNCYIMAKGCEDCKYVLNGFPTLKDAMDCSYCGEKTERVYECLASGESMQSLYFCNLAVMGGSNLFYCHYTMNSENCFGCFGIRHKKYCILNKQYTKEEYEELVPKIIEHMKATGEWGEYFPVKYSPFAYNETTAYEYFPLRKEKVKVKGWKWRDELDHIPDVHKKIPSERLPNSIDDIPDDVLNWAIICERSKRPFKITKQELNFYRKNNLRIPHLHPDERHKERMKLRNLREIHKRSCDKCQRDIYSSYAADIDLQVYCEACYLQDVY